MHSDLIRPLLDLPLRLPQSAWVGHVPFMQALVTMLRPRSIVELGVYNGCSLIAAAAAVRRAGLATELRGVDTWQGDEHAGYYDGDVMYDDLARLVRAEFPTVRLMRTTFDEAVGQFAPGSIDLLHIDGMHSYEVVRHDYETWRDRVAPGGVILFHDTQVRERGFGVWRLWEELQSSNRTFEFVHGYGLGVLMIEPLSETGKVLWEVLGDPVRGADYRTMVEACADTLQLRFGAVGPESNRTRSPALARVWARVLRAFGR